MLKNTYRFEVKALDEKGTFEGVAAVYGNVDQGDDLIEPGAFQKSIKDRGSDVPILWQHDSREPIGIGKLSDSRDGLVIKGQLVLESPVAQKAYALMKAGVLRGLSIGYDNVKSKVISGVRHLQEIKLWEVSVVTFPMNEMATVVAVKSSIEPDELKQFSSLIKTCRKESGLDRRHYRD